MRKVARTRLAAVCLAALAAAPLVPAPAARAEAPDVWAITGARVVPVSGPVLERATVVMRGGLIADVGPAARVPADARVIDGSRLTVYPGLIDAAAPVGAEAQGPQQGGPGAGQQGPSRGPDRENPPGVYPNRRALAMPQPGGAAESYRNAGVTTVLEVPQTGIFEGQSALMNTAGEGSAAMAVKSPVALHVAFETQGGFTTYPGSLMGVFSVVRQKLLDARRYKAEWDRYGRTQRGYRRPAPSEQLEALVPALDRALPVVFQANADKEIRRAVRLAEEFNLRYVISGGLEAWKSADLLKANDVPVLVSLNFPEREKDADPEAEEPLRALRARDEAPANAARLQRAGVRFAFESGGLKSPKEFVANAAKAVAAGLPKEQALRAMTLSAAEILGAAEQLGSIEKGKIANLVVTDGDLFDKKTKVRYVFVDGARFEIKEDAPPAPSAAPTVDVTGTWTLSISIPSGPTTAVLALRQSGSTVTGTITPEGLQATDVRAGVVSGNTLSGVVTLTQGGQTFEARFTATVEGDRMRGTVTAPAFGTLDFTGSRPRSAANLDSIKELNDDHVDHPRR